MLIEESMLEFLDSFDLIMLPSLGSLKEPYLLLSPLDPWELDLLLSVLNIEYSLLTLIGSVIFCGRSLFLPPTLL